MSVALRLSRGGSKKRPYYKIIVASSRSPRDGKYLEQIGTYNPLLAKDDADRVRLSEDRVRYWLGVGAQPTDRVARMIDKAGIKERAPTSNPQKGEPGKKARERAEDKATKLAEAEEARREAEEAAKAAPEAPAEAETAPAAETAPEVAAADGDQAGVNEATPDSDAGDTPGDVEGESAQAPAEG